MILGAPIVHSCPHCGQKIEGPNVCSGNSFGARYFSDGYTIMPMLPEIPEITKCPGCQNFFWLNEAGGKSDFELLIDAIYNDDKEVLADNETDFLPDDMSNEVIGDLDKEHEKNLKKEKSNKKRSTRPKQQVTDSVEELPWL